MSANDITISLQGNNINSLKQLPFFEKPIKAKIKQLNTDNSLSGEPFFKQPIRKPRVKKLSNHELLQVLPFYDKINVLRKARAFKKHAETYGVEIINNTSLSDSLSVSKNSKRNYLMNY